MKLATILHEGRQHLIASIGANRAIALDTAYRKAGYADCPKTLNDLIESGPEELKKAQQAVAISPEAAEAIDLDQVTWLPPQPKPSKIIGVAFNNMGIRKAAYVDPGVPNFFLKAPSSLTGHRQPIIVREHYGETIPELELAGVIGRRCKDVSVEEAREAIFGFSIINDITSHGLKFGLDSIATAREPEMLRPHHFGWRKRHGEEDRDVYYVYHTRSKASDTFGPMGPWITTRDEVADPNNLNVQGWLDGEAFAVDNTSSYRFKVEEVVAEASRYFTLEPGDIFCFGTSAKGVGRFPAGHRSVDLHQIEGTVDIEIEGLGRLSNPVRRN